MVDPFESKRALVVGGAGFVGSTLVRALLETEIKSVTVVDNLLSAERENLPTDERIDFREASIVDDTVLADIEDRYEFVFHLATYHGNESSLANPLADHQHSLLSTVKLLEYLSSFETVERVVYTSTGCALAPKGDGPTEPVTESGPVPLDHDSPYQISKVSGEMYCVYYHRAVDLPVVRARFQNVYGPGEVLGAGEWRGTEHTVWRNVVPTFVYRALKGLPLEVHGEGRATRDFIYVEDVVEGLLTMAKTSDVGGEVFNVATGDETTIRHLARTVNDLTGNDAGIEFIPRRSWDRSIHRSGSPRKAKAELGFEATTTLREGLERTIAWTRENMELVDRCVRQHEEHYKLEL